MTPRLRGHLTSWPPWLPAALTVVVLGASAGGYEVLGPHAGHASGTSVADQGPLRPGASPAGGPQPGQTQASTAQPAGMQPELAQVAAEIQQSARARAAVLRAVRGVNACTMTPVAGMKVLYAAIAWREAALDQLASVPVSAIPGGRAMSAELRLALRESIAADQDFIEWMQDIQAAGCPVRPGRDLSYQAALRASARAAGGKQLFLAHWNPAARRLSLPTFTAGRI
ncbi:MAG: hypothetical protein ABJB47_14580 [Actinomycetota bacterium]